MPNTLDRNTEIKGNTQKPFKFLFLAFLLTGCNSATLESNAKHYQSRAVQIMHVTRDISYGDEHNTYSKLYKEWRRENAEARQQAYYQTCLTNLEMHKPKQLLSPGRSNSPVGGSHPLSEEMAQALPTGTL